MEARLKGVRMFRDTPLSVTLPASDLDRAVAWYRDVLELEPVETTEMRVARYETGGTPFIIYESAYAGTNKATAAGWEVDDVGSLVSRLKEKGVEFQEFEVPGMTWNNSVLTAPNGYQSAWMVDSEGNILGLSSRSDT